MYHTEEVIMRVNFRFFNLAVWGSIVIMQLVIMGCSNPADSGLTGPASNLPSQTTPDDGDGEKGEQNPGDGQETPDNGDGGNGEQNPGDGQETPDNGDGGNGEQNPGGGDEAGQTPGTGRVGIRIGGMAKPAEGTYPDLSGITRYRLDFSGNDGRTAESRYLEAGRELDVTLDAGEWDISAYGFLEKGTGQPSLAVISGTARVVVSEGGTKTVLIVPSKPLTESGEPGFLSWNISYPAKEVWGAALTVSLKIDEDNFIPYTYVDLTGAGAESRKISLPSGTYRMESRFLSHNTAAGSTELVHIYPGLETGSSRVDISAAAFPVPREFSSTDKLKKYLAGLPENTLANPYPVKITGVDLSSKEKNGETLKTLYDALKRYVTLDLRECSGAEIFATTMANRAYIVSLILPDSVTEISPGGFSGYASLKSVVMPKVTIINTSAFKNCKQLETVFAPELETVADAPNRDTGAFARDTALKAVYAPKLAVLGKYALYGSEGLTGLAFPNLQIVGGLAFKGCTALKAVSLPAAAKITSGSFVDNTALAYLVFGLNPPAFDTSVFGNTDFPQAGVIFVPPDAEDTYKNTLLSGWSTLKERVKPLPGPVLL
jgi:hypothetical protein